VSGDDIEEKDLLCRRGWPDRRRGDGGARPSGAVTFFRSDLSVGNASDFARCRHFNGGSPISPSRTRARTTSRSAGKGSAVTPASPVSVGTAPKLHRRGASSTTTPRRPGDSQRRGRTTLRSSSAMGPAASAVRTPCHRNEQLSESIATGDFNNDNKTDLISANTASSTISILPGRDGGFAAIRPRLTLHRGHHRWRLRPSNWGARRPLQTPTSTPSSPVRPGSGPHAGGRRHWRDQRQRHALYGSWDRRI